MKKILRRLSVFLLLAAFIPSCNLLEDCKTCKMVTETNGSKTYGTGIPTCGDELDKRMSDDPVTINGTTTYWECN
jgi:hypothetical protein